MAHLKARTGFGFAIALVVGLASGMALPARAETSLKSVTGVSSQTVVAQVFLRWVEDLGKMPDAPVRFDYIGGPEITPPFQQAQALKRGLFDVLYAPSSFYAGQVKEVDALIASNLPVSEMRENGTWDYLQKLWGEQLDVHVLGWFDTAVSFHMYFGEGAAPKVTAAGADLSGIKMFSTATFREFQEALGAVPVAMKTDEIMTGMDRGLIQGLGWPQYGMTGLGLQRVIKLRLDPTFYRGNILTLVNKRKWMSLTEAERTFLTEQAIAYEARVPAFVEAEIEREQNILKENGMKVVALEGEAAANYQRLAHDIAWKRLEERSPEYAAKLRELMYDPNRF